MHHTSVENKPIDTDNLIASNTDLLNKLLLVTHSTQGSHEPTIAITPLTNIGSRRPIHEELRLLKNLLYHISAFHPKTSQYPKGKKQQYTHSNPLNTPRPHLLIRLIQPIKIMPPTRLQVQLNIKMRISILLVHPLALLDNPINGFQTLSSSLLV
jgi:hypothetical protein